MRLSGQLMFLVLSFWSLQALASNDIATVLSKSEHGHWRAHFSAKQPVQQIAFQRSPDSSRIKRWKARSPEFEIRKINQEFEAVRRIDGQPFTAVEFDLTPTYISLPKDYAPFSPYSDGGMLVYTGRFFACAELCVETINQWQFTVRAPKGDHIIVGGVVHFNEVSWLERDSGQNIYVGKGEPIADEHFISLIDSKLPPALKTLMAQKLPKIVAYFAEKLPALTYRPSLFASYSTTEDGSYGHQGGTLPGQIFMHWYGNKAMAGLDEHHTFWFFAHEIAHLYQGPGANIESLTDAWVHEGTAELFAAIAYSEINDSAQLFQSKLFQSKLATAKADCLRSVATQPSYHQVASANPRVHYSCGLLLLTALHQELTQRGGDIFQLWQAYNHAIAKGKPATATTFAEVSKPLLSEASYLKLVAFTKNDEINAQQYFEELAVRLPSAGNL